MKQNKKTHRGDKHIVSGVVVSNSMDKTICVKVYRVVKHSHYKKLIKKSSVFKAHDENNKARVGDSVRIVEVRPLSKTKRWKLVEETAKPI